MSAYPPSFTELALRAKRALILGVGGGGDVIQSIPVGNHLRLLGVEELIVGGVGSAWWTPAGEPISSERGLMTFGPTAYDVSELTPHEPWTPGIVGVSSETRHRGRRPAEATLAHLLPGTPFVADLLGGAAGLRDALRALIAARGIDLVVGVDIGSDSFHDGREVVPAQTSLVDFLSLGALIGLDTPVVYALAGYGADGEMQLEELDERVSRVMKAGGFLGAIGLTHRDVDEMLAACALYPDPIEHYAALAARGEFGYRHVQTASPWGSAVKITPLAATVLMFDPRVMAREVCVGVEALKHTRSLAEAEAIYATQLGQIPETRLKPTIRFMKPQT